MGEGYVADFLDRELMHTVTKFEPLPAAAEARMARLEANVAAMEEKNAALQALVNAQPAVVPARGAREEEPLKYILFFKFRQRLSSPLPTPRSRWSMKDKYPSHKLTEAEENECKSPAEEEAWKQEHVVAGLLGPNASVQARIGSLDQGVQLLRAPQVPCFCWMVRRRKK